MNTEEQEKLIADAVAEFEAGLRLKAGQPAHVHGVALRRGLLDTTPSSMEYLTKSAFDTDTASPYTFKFDEPERGKALYIVSSWKTALHPLEQLSLLE
jgi:hypothetical protein